VLHAGTWHCCDRHRTPPCSCWVRRSRTSFRCCARRSGPAAGRGGPPGRRAVVVRARTCLRAWTRTSSSYRTSSSCATSSRDTTWPGPDVTWERTFLRWDREWSLAGRPAGYDGSVAADELSTAMLHRAADEARYSSDWWRQVGAVAARTGRSWPSRTTSTADRVLPYVDGDPRNEFTAVSTVNCPRHPRRGRHRGRAARTGSAGRADLYVSTFPCPGVRGWSPRRASGGSTSPAVRGAGRRRGAAGGRRRTVLGAARGVRPSSPARRMVAGAGSPAAPSWSIRGFAGSDGVRSSRPSPACREPAGERHHAMNHRPAETNAAAWNAGMKPRWPPPAAAHRPAEPVRRQPAGHLVRAPDRVARRGLQVVRQRRSARTPRICPR
jgi:hypothetical protein